MKQLKNFLENAPLWQIFALSGLCCFMFCIPLFWKMLGMPINDSIAVATFSGIFYGIIVIILSYFSRAKSEFWASVVDFEDLIDAAKTKEELDAIRIFQYPKLKSICPQNIDCIFETERLYSKLINKYYYLQL